MKKLIVVIVLCIADVLIMPDGVTLIKAGQETTHTIIEKTLVAWVSPADLEQAGGGVLSIDDRRNKEFDSIVFGEVKAKTWMAGSYNKGSNTMEIVMEVDPRHSRDFWVSVLRSPDGREHTNIHYYRRANMNSWRSEQVPPYEDLITIDTSRSSLHRDIHPRGAEQAPFQLKDGEILKLRIFVDRSLVEVFANDRQYVAQRVYPKRDDSRTIALGAWGDNVVVKSLTVYQMKSIYTEY